MLGAIEGHCTAAQLEVAGRWWALFLPAWPHWVSLLRAAGVGNMRAALLRTAKGSPTPLVFKAHGAGTVPHFHGQAQNRTLERDPAVAVEVYACVTCLWQAAAVPIPVNDISWIAMAGGDVHADAVAGGCVEAVASGDVEAVAGGDAEAVAGGDVEAVAKGLCGSRKGSNDRMATGVSNLSVEQ